MVQLLGLFSNVDPQYKGKVGVVVSERMVDRFVINFDGKDHPYLVHRLAMQEVK